MPNLTHRLGPLRPAADQPAADRSAMSSIAPFVSVAAFLTLIQGAPVTLADLTADVTARALWDDSMFLGQWTGPAAILSLIILSAAQRLPRAATGPLHVVAHDNPSNFRDLGRALANSGFTWIAGFANACRPRNQGGDSHFAIRRALTALIAWAEAGTALFPPFLCVPAFATAPPAGPNETWVAARVRRLQDLIPWAFAHPGLVVGHAVTNLIPNPLAVMPAAGHPAVVPPAAIVLPAVVAPAVVIPAVLPAAAHPAAVLPAAAAAAAVLPAVALPAVLPAAAVAAAGLPAVALPAAVLPAAAVAPAAAAAALLPANCPAPMPGQEHAASSLDQKFAGKQMNRAYPTTVITAMMKEMHRALELSAGAAELIAILDACVPMVIAHVPYAVDPYNFQFAQLAAYFCHHQAVNDGRNPSPPRIAAAIIRHVPSMTALLNAVDAAVDQDAKLVARERLHARTALGHRTEAEIQAELHHKALMAAIASTSPKRPNNDAGASPGAKKPRDVGFSPGILSLIEIYRSRKPGLTVSEAKELAKKLLSGRCTGCALPRAGFGRAATCPTTGCLRDQTLCLPLEAEAKAQSL